MSPDQRTVQRNVETCTTDMMIALEAMIGGSGDKALIYGNSAIAAVIVVFRKYGVDKDLAREMFKDLWSPITGSTACLDG